MLRCYNKHQRVYKVWCVFIHMTIRRYNVTLEKEVVQEARQILLPQEKLSPIINELLKEWIKNKKEDARRI